MIYSGSVILTISNWNIFNYASVQIRSNAHIYTVRNRSQLTNILLYGDQIESISFLWPSTQRAKPPNLVVLCLYPLISILCMYYVSLYFLLLYAEIIWLKRRHSHILWVLWTRRVRTAHAQQWLVSSKEALPEKKDKRFLRIILWMFSIT